MRSERVADSVRDVVASFFQAGRLNDPRLQGVTVTAAKVTRDLQLASVYFRVYDDSQRNEALKGMNSARNLFKKQLAKDLDLRVVPELRFYYDVSVENGSRIEELLFDLNH